MSIIVFSSDHKSFFVHKNTVSKEDLEGCTKFVVVTMNDYVLSIYSKYDTIFAIKIYIHNLFLWLQGFGFLISSWKYVFDKIRWYITLTFETFYWLSID